MTIKFYLDKPGAEQETAIYLFMRFGKTTLKFNTGKKVHPKFWNTKTPANHFRKFTGSPEMNQWLNSLKGSIDLLYYSKPQWSIQELKEGALDIVNEKVPQDTAKTFQTALEDFINSRENNNNHAVGTIKKYKTVKSHLLSFSSKQKSPLRFEIINKKFFEDFSAYLRNEVGNTNNTVNKSLKTVKTIINWAVDNGYVKADVVSTKFKISEQPTEIIYLTFNELMKIYNLKLLEGSTLDKVRDIFCFGCFTGQRFSDIKNLKREDIVNDVWLLHQVKVKDTIQNEIPLTNFAKAILSKYLSKDKPLPVMSNQKTNQYLKELGKEAEIDEPCKLVRYKGNDPIIIREPKYKLLGTHTARRTFVTLSLEKGMRPEVVMSITGHEDYKTMKRYLAITNKIKDTEMKVAWNSQNVSVGEISNVV